MIDINIKGLEEVSLYLQELDGSINIQDTLDTMGAYQLHRIRERFLNQTDTNGNKWPESDAAKLRKATGRDGGTLFDTGDLFHSITLGRHDNNSRRIYTNQSYAGVHQLGLYGQEKREFLGFSSSDIAGLVNICNHRIEESLG